MEELISRIEDYLDNTLTDDERAAFEADLQSNPVMAEALAVARESRERLTRHWAQENAEVRLRETLKGLGKQHFDSIHNNRRITPRRWWVAAAAVIATMVIWLAWPPGEDALYRRYREFPEASFTLKNGGEQILDQAAKSFNIHKFDAALVELNSYLAQRPEDSEVRFFTGLCQLELGQLVEAETTFGRIVSSENAWSGEARWYLALTHLRSKQREKCREILREIPAGGAHFAEAQKLMKNL